MSSINEFEVPRLFDAHVHWRQGMEIYDAVAATDRCCDYALVMPNIIPSIRTDADVIGYRNMVTKALKESGRNSVEPLFTFKLTDETTPDMVSRIHKCGVSAGKIYPAGVTHNSYDGVSRLTMETMPDRFLEVLATMQDLDIVLCIHAEMPECETLNREFEAVRFVKNVLDQFGSLRVVVEHVSDARTLDLVEYYHKQRGNVACTVTLHHLYLTLDDVIGDKLKPHNFCKPIAKQKFHRSEIVRNVLRDVPWIFLGSDSAPHTIKNKECADCCAGIYTAPILAEGLAKFFDEHDAIDKMANFVAHHGETFYRIGPPKGKLRFVRKPMLVPNTYQIGYDRVVPFWAGTELPWSVV